MGSLTVIHTVFMAVQFSNSGLQLLRQMFLNVYRFLPVDGEDAVKGVLVAFPCLEPRLHQ